MYIQDLISIFRTQIIYYNHKISFAMFSNYLTKISKYIKINIFCTKESNSMHKTSKLFITIYGKTMWYLGQLSILFWVLKWVWVGWNSCHHSKTSPQNIVLNINIYQGYIKHFTSNFTWSPWHARCTSQENVAMTQKHIYTKPKHPFYFILPIWTF